MTGGLFIVLVILLLTLIPKGVLIFYASRKSKERYQADNKETITEYAEPKIDHYFEEIRELAIHNDPLF